MEQWRKFNEEEGEEEKESTPEDKLKDLFSHNAVQALHIAEQVDIDPKMLAAMKEVISKVHGLMKIYRDSVNAATTQEVNAVDGVGDLYKEFERAWAKIYARRGRIRPPRSKEVMQMVYDLYGIANLARQYWASSKKLRAIKTDHPKYREVADWAGEPQ
jgi:hypothetical protein